MTRYEIRGIILSVLALVLVLLGFRFYTSPRVAVEVSSTESDIITVNPSEPDQDAALKRAITAGSTVDGEVKKLIVSDIVVGDGREAKVGDTVTVHYIGLLKDGPEFDNSYKKGEPFSFKVGAGEVIKGWDQGIIGIKEGGKRILVVPPTLGYGNTPVNTLPANATLLFSIELLSIR